ncbi:potassium-transporting ATPase subunit KdpC [Tabrizicola sp. J26]|uniref:potassium-transporting ATPase subunit KdpC n=1 Tax=Alitabrizicola rongguiensis TaxID=2909234 RepID=UPI001F3263C1|nr:potassium-transporting ATPase subunit KdpC [Tabrizicola rongguiensis]MCF1710717.1 potassium-transporting ATPase subunit KdpC [Tabrizicola rongguiensis]
MFLQQFRPALVLTLGFTFLTGLAYPLAITGFAGLASPEASEGSLIISGNEVIGSRLIAQPFSGAGYLHPRPSASGWNAAGTSASNLGPTSAKLIADVAQRRAAYETENGQPAPIDAVTGSASGLDPDISPENALAQAERIAKARGVEAGAVLDLIETHVESPLLGLYGLPRINVLETNLALDATFPLPTQSPGN